MAKQTIQIADKPTVDEILALLESAEVGLAALKSEVGKGADATTLTAVKTLLENGTYGLNALDKDLTTIVDYLANTTYGLNALKTAINGRANETTVAAIKALLENSTYGLNAISKKNSYSTVQAFDTSVTFSGQQTANSTIGTFINITGKGKATVLFEGVSFQENIDYGIFVDGVKLPYALIDFDQLLTYFEFEKSLKITFDAIKNVNYASNYTCVIKGFYQLT